MSDSKANEEYVRDGRIGQVLNDYLDRRARGQAEPEAEFMAKNPDLAEDLRLHLDMLRELSPPEARIDALVCQGVLSRSSDPHYASELGPYKIAGLVGRGGMGIVLRAYEESLNRTVALKILRPELSEDQAAPARFTREAKAAAALRHPNIVTVHSVGQERGAHWVAGETPTVSSPNGGRAAHVCGVDGRGVGAHSPWTRAGHPCFHGRGQAVGGGGADR